jgi:hypothetical protein
MHLARNKAQCQALVNMVINRITGVSDFIHRPDFNNYKKKEQTRRFGNWICFRPHVIEVSSF